MKDLIEALTILLKYCENDVYTPTHCEHDELHVTCVMSENVSEEDLKKLEELGFHPTDFGFKSYRFGSS